MPKPEYSSDINATIHKLRQQIEQLTEEQSKALRSAVFVGMTPAGAKEYDQRREKIMQLAAHLQQLLAAQQLKSAFCYGHSAEQKKPHPATAPGGVFSLVWMGALPSPHERVRGMKCGMICLV